MKIDMSRFRQTFFQEAADHVNNMESALLALGAGPADPELLNSIFRAAHSIKGSGATFGFDDLTRFTHRLEELLERMRQGKIETSPDRVQLLLRACDVLRGLLAAADTGGPPPDEAQELLEKLVVAQRSGEFALERPQHLRAHDPAAKLGAQTSFSIHFSPSPNIFREGMDPLLIFRELRELGSTIVIADLSHLPELGELQAETCYLAWNISLTTEKDQAEVQDVFAFVEEGAQIKITARSADEGNRDPAQTARTAAPQRRQQTEASIRVSTQKVDQLINLVGELVISHSIAVEIAGHFSAERLPELHMALGEVGRNTRELQDRAMSVRMLPVGTVFARMPRIVHDIANASGKSIRIDLAGEETELDKTLLEGIVDPLMHLVRNAADHGIDMPANRKAAGKSEQGTIRLEARHESGNFVIDVADDGRGLDTERIRQKAIERGLMTAGEELTAEQIQAFVFHAGFSTADKVSEISGRGVGMDVVRRNVEALGGVVTFKSVAGKGTTFSIRLPLTLAILDGQLVRVGAQTYVLPLVAIVESVRPTREQVRTVAGQGEVVTVRQEPLPLLRLHRLFGVATDVVDPCSGLVVIVEHNGRRLALLVDELLSQQQVVIKNLQANFRRVEGAMGATILGDGRVTLILDVAGLVELSRRAALTVAGKSGASVTAAAS